MRFSGRRPFVFTTILMLVVAVVFLAMRWPLPWGRPPSTLQATFSRDALLSLAGSMGLGWAFVVVPWSGLLALRMRARHRSPGLALIPLGLAGIAALTTAIGGGIYGAPETGPPGGDTGPLVDWMNEDFIMLETIVLTAIGTAALALIVAMALAVDALRPDKRGIDQIFS